MLFKTFLGLNLVSWGVTLGVFVATGSALCLIASLANGVALSRMA